MTIERAFRFVHHLDIPEAKRRYWPQFAEVVVSRDDTVADVFQFFERPSEEQQIQALQIFATLLFELFFLLFAQFVFALHFT